MVAVSGNTAIVGSRFMNVGGKSGAGVVYVYVRSGSKWTKQAELTAPDGIANDQFGAAVALSGNTALVQAIYRSVNGQSYAGTVYVFVRSGRTWKRQAEFEDPSPAANEDFGASLALSGNTAAVGLPYKSVNGNTDAGAVYLYQRSGTTWSAPVELTAADGATSDLFGADGLALSGHTLLVGAIGRTVAGHTFCGAVYVFTGSGLAWTQSTRIDDPNAVTGDSFGIATAVSGGTVLIGAPSQTVGGLAGAGAAYVFEGTGASWTKVAELDDPNAATGDQFGHAVALSGATAVVGAPGRKVGLSGGVGVAYDYSGAGPVWKAQGQLPHPDAFAGDEFGSSLSFSADTVFVGAPSKWVAAAEMRAGVAYAVLAYPHVRITLKASAPSIKLGKSVVVRGAVDPPVPGIGTVSISRRVNGKLSPLKKGAVSASGVFAVSVKPASAGTWTLVATYRVGASTFKSKAVTVTVKA